MAGLQPRIKGLGYEVPANIRTNTDPIFDWLNSWLKSNPNAQNPFTGYTTRHVLAEGEDLMTVMVPAALKAITDADVKASEIDMLLGDASVSPYTTPNELSRLHQMLGLPAHAWVVPLNNEFSNFNAGLVFADALIKAGRAKNILIVVGGNWTRYVDYHTVQSVSAGDGAGAAVVGLSADSAKWQVIDQKTLTVSENYGTMYMRGAKYPQNPTVDGHSVLWSDPFFQITTAGLQDFGSFGGKAAPQAVLDLLANNQLTGNDIALIAHQASQSLIDAWVEAILPAQFVSTISNFANMTVANIPVTLAWSVKNHPVTVSNLVLFALAPDMHANALLLRRA
jgi:3-oxoacyl-[acyl-carrier-protein] synthase-3